ncbi:unnamed protein product, partial [Effrenium voratum]
LKLCEPSAAMASPAAWPAVAIDLRAAVATEEPQLGVVPAWARRQTVEHHVLGTQLLAWLKTPQSHKRRVYNQVKQLLHSARGDVHRRRYSGSWLRLGAAEFCALTGRTTTPREDRLRLLLATRAARSRREQTATLARQLMDAQEAAAARREALLQRLREEMRGCLPMLSAAAGVAREVRAGLPAEVACRLRLPLPDVVWLAGRWPAPADVAWDALCDPERLRRQLQGAAEGSLRRVYHDPEEHESGLVRGLEAADPLELVWSSTGFQYWLRAELSDD